jgi:hypothetical protein
MIEPGAVDLEASLAPSYGTMAARVVGGELWGGKLAAVNRVRCR